MKLTLDEIQERIENCGKETHFVQSVDTTWTTQVEYCGYYWDNGGFEPCPRCRAYKASVLATQIEKNLRSVEHLFTCVIDDKLDWARLHRKLCREKISFQRQPLPDGNALIVVSQDPCHRDFCFTERGMREVVAELTTDDALFTKDCTGSRSSSRDWPLTPKVEEEVEETVTIKVLKPRFVHSKAGDTYKIPFSDLYRLVSACNTWDGGDPLDDPQRYRDVNSSTLIELALASGYELDYEKTVVKEEQVPVSEIKLWKAYSYEKENEQFFGETASGKKYDKENFYGLSGKLVAIIQGNTEIPSWTQIVEERKAEQTKQHKIKKIVKEYVDVYQSNDMTFKMMHGEETLMYVKEQLEMAKVYEEFGEAFFLTVYSKDDLKTVM